MFFPRPSIKDSQRLRCCPTWAVNSSSFKIKRHYKGQGMSHLGRSCPNRYWSQLNLYFCTTFSPSTLHAPSTHSFCHPSFDIPFVAHRQTQQLPAIKTRSRLICTKSADAHELPALKSMTARTGCSQPQSLNDGLFPVLESKLSGSTF